MKEELVNLGSCQIIDYYLFADGKYRTDTDEDRDKRYEEMWKEHYNCDPSDVEDLSRFGK
tara:strand:+ start:297 stop:476 length:180 start_codon:yes stop_codon:yes gene_type:complete